MHRHLLSLVVLAAAQAAQAATYDSDAGFSAHIPSGYQHCEHGASDHGFAVYLDKWSSKDGCVFSNRPVLSVTSELNSLDWADATVALDFACTVSPGRRMAAPEDLAFANAPVVACLVERNDGGIEIFAVAPSGGSGPSADDPNVTVSGAFITAYLHTTPKRYAKDLALFREVARTVRVHKDE